MADTPPPNADRNRTRHRVVKAGLACLATWLAAHHWPLIPLIYARMNRERPGPAAVRYMLAHTGEGVAAALTRDDIHAGQTVDDVIARFGPFDVETAGRFQRLRDPQDQLGFAFEAYWIVARDGSLVAAGWFTCVADVTFFDTLTEDERKECLRMFDEHRKWLALARRDARMAVGSPAAWWGDKLWDDYQRSAEPNAQMAVAGPPGYVAHGSLPPLPNEP